MASSGSNKLLLFVRGNTARSMQAITTVRAACQRHAGWEQALSVVDVFAEPGLAERYRVVATPTLISLGPTAERRWVGNVANIGESLFQGSALVSSESSVRASSEMLEAGVADSNGPSGEGDPSKGGAGGE